MPGLFTPSIVFTFITHYWFFHHNTLNSDALLDPCFKTGYLTCKTYKSRRTLVVETLDRTRNQGTISCPPARTPEKRPRAPFKNPLLPGRDSAVKTKLYQNQAWFHHSPPLSSPSPPPYQKNHSKPWPFILTSRQIVPSIQFQVLLTLFSQFFSTFLRSTSPLSVSMSYLGLEEIYLPFYALFPKYATRKQKEIRETKQLVTGLSPSLAPISIELHKCLIPTSLLLKRCIGVLHYWNTPFSFDLFHLRSPLLMESHLISFPGVNNMLKFTP